MPIQHEQTRSDDAASRQQRRRPPPPRPRRHRHAQHAAITVICLACAILVGNPSHVHAQQQQQPQEAPDSDDIFIRIHRVALLQREDPIARAGAARELLASGRQEAFALLTHSLTAYDRPDVIEAVCRAIIDTQPVPGQLLEPLLAAFLSAPDDSAQILGIAIRRFGLAAVDRIDKLIDEAADDAAGDSASPRQIALVQLLGQFRRIEAVRILIPRLAPDQARAIRAAAQQSLIQITGVAETSATPEAWSDWLQRNEPRGQEALLESYIDRLEHDLANLSRSYDAQAELFEARAREADQQQNELREALAASLTQEYLRTGVEQRQSLLQTFLGHDLAAVRSQGLFLVKQRKSNDEPVGPALTDAVAAKIADVALEVRADAVGTLGLLDGPRTAQLVLPMLAATDTGADVLQASVEVLGRYPLPEAVDSLVRILGDPTSKVEPELTAYALIAACLNRLISDIQLDAIAAALLADDREPGAAGPYQLELLAWTDDPGALDLVVSRLNAADRDDDDRALRESAARGLARSRHRLDDLRSLAADPVVYPWVIESFFPDPTLDSLKIAVKLSAPDGTAQALGIGRIIQRLAPEAWLQADDLLAGLEAIEPEQRIRWLSRIFDLKGVRAAVVSGNGNGEVIDNPTKSAGAEETGGDQTPDDESAKSGAGDLPPHQHHAICVRIAELQLQIADLSGVLTTLASAPAIDDADSTVVDRIRLTALIGLGRFEDLPPETQPIVWLDALELVVKRDDPDPKLARSIADRIRSLFDESLSEAQRARLDRAASKIAPTEAADAGDDNDEPSPPPGPDQPDNDNDGGDDGDGNDGGGGYC